MTMYATNYIGYMIAFQALGLILYYSLKILLQELSPSKDLKEDAFIFGICLGGSATFMGLAFLSVEGVLALVTYGYSEPNYVTLSMGAGFVCTGLISFIMSLLIWLSDMPARRAKKVETVANRAELEALIREIEEETNA